MCIFFLFIEVVLIYVYEALVIVLASNLIGSSIGLLTAISLAAQSCIFTEMPFEFALPWTILFEFLFLSFVVAVIIFSCIKFTQVYFYEIAASVIPTYKLVKSPISHVLKGL